MNFEEIIQKQAENTARKYSRGDYNKHQEIYVACIEEAWAKLEKLDETKNIKAFLSIIMKNAVYDLYKKERPTMSIDAASTIASSMHTDMVDDLDTDIKFNSLLHSVSERDQTILKALRNELSIKQIAQLIGETPDNTTTIICRSRPKWQKIYYEFNR